jgi:hypothetical protein
MPIRFKTAGLDKQLLRSHPALQSALLLFEDYGRANHLPDPIVTDVMDAPESDRNHATTWHRPTKMCAVDIRTAHYSRGELAAVEAWFKARFDRPLWELITTLHGTGPHIHLARRDFNFTPQEEVANG